MRSLLSRRGDSARTNGAYTFLRPAACQVEELEDRTLRSVTTWSNAYVTGLGSYDYAAFAYVGENVASPSPDTVKLSTPYATVADAAVQWDTTPEDAFTSEETVFTFTFDASGNDTLSWTIGGTTLSYTAGSGLSNISAVNLGAYVTEWGMSFKFSELAVSFYNGNTLISTQSPGDLEATTINYGESGEAGASITSESANATKVVVGGKLQFTSPWNSYPSEYSAFGAITITGS